MNPTTLLVGTTKGLVVFEKQSSKWIIQKVHFLGMSVTTVYVDTVNRVWWVGITHHHWGQKLQYSADRGITWQSVAPPKYPASTLLSSNRRASLKKIWCIQQGGNAYPNKIWIGTEPGGLFVSENYGKTFQLVEGLWNHPSRTNRQQWFGTGRSEPFIHSIIIDPREANHIYIAISCAGIFETVNGGNTWQPKNKGLIATYLPNPTAEVGHDPHRLLMCQQHPNVLWQQNHCGVFRSENGGDTWQDVSDKNGIVNYGFALSIDHENPNRAWVIPAISDEVRVAPELMLTVCYTENAGQDWQSLQTGLSQAVYFDIVFRHAFDRQLRTLAFGTTTGNIYLSENDGRNWTCLSNNLARVDCVTFD